MLLTHEEIKAIIMGLARRRGEAGFTREEALHVVNEASGDKTVWTTWTCVIKGMVDVDWNGSEVVFVSKEKR